MRKLNLGCGADIRKGYDNLDCVKNQGVDLICDLNKFPYPIEEDTYDEIYAKFILEHLDNIEECLREWYRILKKEGTLIIQVPYDISYSAWANFQHKRAFNLKTFKSFAKNTRKDAITQDYGLTFCFSRLKQKLWFSKGFHIFNHLLEPLFNSIQRLYEETGLRALFPAHSIIIEMIK